MIAIRYAPIFVRMYKGLETDLKREIQKKITLFQDARTHSDLKVHKLKGIDNTYSFSVNYKIRVIFEYESKTIVNLLKVGNHDDVYE